jgi:hypothetical protein
MLQFVPLTDEMLYSWHGPTLPLVPYRCGLACARDDQRCTVNASPDLTPSLSAMPALSSSTYRAAPPDG